MAMTIAKLECSICNNEINAYKYEGYSKTCCVNYLTEYHQIINKQLNEIENNHGQLRQKIMEQKQNPKNHSLIEQINKWEEDSIQKIRQTAEECRQKLFEYTNKNVNYIENKLNDFAIQLKEICQENEFNQMNLDQLKHKLTKLEEELDKSKNISIKQQSSSFINKISITLPFSEDTKWKQLGITITGRNGHKKQLNQIFQQYGIFVDDNQTIYLADWNNHRIVEWNSNATNGHIIAAGNEVGYQTNQLNGPTAVIIDKENNSLIISDYRNRRVVRWFLQDNTNTEQIIIWDIDCFGLTINKNGDLYVSDCRKNEVTRWKRGETSGTIVAGGNGAGNQLNQLNFPTHIFVDDDDSLYVSDSNNHRVMKWLKNGNDGIIVAGGNGKGNSLTQLNYPYGVVVDQLGQIYVADFGNDRVMRWCKGDKEGSVIVGGNGEEQPSNQLNHPVGLSFDGQGNLYVVDCWNDRIQKFEIV